MTFHNDFYNFLIRNSANKVCSILLQSQDLPKNTFLNLIDYIKPETNSIVSFTPIDKLKKAKKSVYIDPFDFRRVRSKVGRLVSKILSEEGYQVYSVSNSDVEDFTNRYKSFFEREETKFIVVSGEDIRKYYDEENYYSSAFGRCGTLWNSCMRYYERLKYLDLYVCNNIKMLVLVNGDDKVRGRALLWDNVIDETSSTIKFMDRIYYTDDYIVNSFKKWASDNGYYHKMEQSSRSERYVISPSGEARSVEWLVKLGQSSFEYYPYLDTFKFFNCSTGILRNHENCGYDYCLVQANGSLVPEEVEAAEEEIIDEV